MNIQVMESQHGIRVDPQRIQVIGLAVALGTGLFTASCAPGDADAARQAADQPAVRVVNVEVTPVAPVEFTGFIRVTGEVEAMSDVTISAEETGRIERFHVRKGQSVVRGQSIAKLEDDLLAAQVEEARASAQLAQEEYERQRQLWEEEGIGTELTYLRRKYQAEIAAARLAQLESRLERTVIRAPLSGILDDRYLEPGEMAIPGAPIARIVSIDKVKIAAGVPERFARFVEPGDDAVVTFDIFPQREFLGQVNFVGTSVNQDSRTFPIEIVLDNAGGIMKPAMVANLLVQRERLSDVIVVPQQVVLRSADGYKVFLATARGDHYVARARTVVLGPVSGNSVVIEEGLEVGDLLITLGQQLVDDNSRIRIVNSAQPGQTDGTS